MGKYIAAALTQSGITSNNRIMACVQASIAVINTDLPTVTKNSKENGAVSNSKMQNMIANVRDVAESGIRNVLAFVTVIRVPIAMGKEATTDPITANMADTENRYPGLPKLPHAEQISSDRHTEKIDVFHD